MKKIILIALLFTNQFSYGQFNINDISNAVNSTLGNNLTNDQITKGLKEALNVGTKNATKAVGKTDGYYKNNLIKIPFPSEAKDMKNTLVSLGLKKQVDAFEKQLNRAAEDAAKKAAPIFLNAITKMTINDGLTILKGKDDEATQYLKRQTTADLKKEFKTIIAASLNKVQITKYWKPLSSSYNQVPFVKKVNPDLEDYVNQMAIDGLFKMVALEEAKIRKDPAARVNDILQTVFGGKK
jgi:polyribonucleotide nucleotidyltransferase